MPTTGAILFDLDGTVTDSALDLSISVNHMLTTLGFPEQPVETIYGYIGRGVRNMLTEALGAGNGALIEQGLRIFREHYWDHCLDNTRLYTGVEDVLKSLVNFKKAVVTNKTFEFARKILEGLEIYDEFDVVLGGDNFPKLKPDPAPVQMACSILAVDTGKALMVGDSINDILSAVSAGALACGVTYGLGTADELRSSGAKWLLDSMTELVPLVGRVFPP